MIDKIPIEWIQFAGLSVFILFGIVVVTTVQEFIKSRFYKNGSDRRKGWDFVSGDIMDKFMEAYERGIESNNKLASVIEKMNDHSDKAIERLQETLYEMSDSFNRPALKALSQHEIIIRKEDEIMDLVSKFKK